MHFIQLFYDVCCVRVRHGPAHLVLYVIAVARVPSLPFLGEL